MAIDDLLDEHEQSERVRNWLRANSAGLIGGVALGLGAIYGWLWWQDKRDNERLQHSDAYQALVEKATPGAGALPGAAKPVDPKAVADAAAKLNETPFAALAALDLAKVQLDAGKRDEAIKTLQGVPAGDPLFATVVRERLARLLIDAGKAADALKLVEAADDVVSHEVRGDALLALGRAEEAKAAYDKALLSLEVGTPLRQLVEFKQAEAAGAQAAKAAPAGGAAPATPAASPAAPPAPASPAAPAPPAAS